MCGFYGTNIPKGTHDDPEAIIQHVQSIHKFGECKLLKKFFRIDHFRLHLKHGHACTSGEWIAKFAEICKADEIPDVPLGAHNNVADTEIHTRNSTSKEREEMQIGTPPQAVQRGDALKDSEDKPSKDDTTDTESFQPLSRAIRRSVIDRVETLQVATKRHVNRLTNEYIKLSL